MEASLSEKQILLLSQVESRLSGGTNRISISESIHRLFLTNVTATCPHDPETPLSIDYSFGNVQVLPFFSRASRGNLKFRALRGRRLEQLVDIGTFKDTVMFPDYLLLQLGSCLKCAISGVYGSYFPSIIIC